MLELQSGKRSRCSRSGPAQGMAASSSGVPHLPSAPKEVAGYFPLLCCSFECSLYSSFLNVLLVPNPGRGDLWSGFTLGATTVVRRLSKGKAQPPPNLLAFNVQN